MAEASSVTLSSSDVVEFWRKFDLDGKRINMDNQVK